MPTEELPQPEIGGLGRPGAVALADRVSLLPPESSKPREG